jgi:phage host-nuclease inhibitor protein Gam
MGRFGRLLDWATKSDAVVSWGERIGKVLLWVLGGPLVTGIVLGVAGWLTQNPLYGVLIGLAAWAIAQVGFTVWAIRKLAVGTMPSAEPQPESATPQPPTPANDAPQLTANWKAYWFSIPTTEVARERLTASLAENEQSAFPNPLIKVLAENERLSTERDEARAETERLKTENERLSAKIQQLDEELKQRCQKLVDELAEFVDERAREHPQKKTWRPNLGEVIPYNKETVEQYSRRFGREVAILLDTLERRGCWSDATERKKFENPRMALSIQNLQALVQRLAVLCERL